MELDVGFDDDDLKFEEAKVVKPDVTTYTAKQCPDQWFEEGFDPNGINVTPDPLKAKFVADLALMKKDFAKAAEFYTKALEGASDKNMIAKRDYLEALTRCHLNLGQLDKAEEWGQAFHATSNPSNRDHLTISLGLLAMVHHAQNRFTLETVCLAQIINFRPFIPDHWLILYEAYSKLDENTELKPSEFAIRNLREIRAFCLIRALTLFQTVQKSVMGCSKERNSKMQSEITKKVRELKLLPDEADRIQMFASMDIYNRGGGDEGSSETSDTDAKAGDDGFVDLGRSTRMNAIQKSFEKKSETGDATSDHEIIMNNFEKNWFSFLEE